MNLKVAVAQFDIVLLAKKQNYNKMELLVEQAMLEGNINLIVFPEAALSGYCIESIDLFYEASESISGKYFTSICSLAQKFSIHIVFGFLATNVQPSVPW